MIPVGGKRILDRIYEVFSQVFDEIFLVSNHPIRYLEWDLNIVTDLYPLRSSLTGIHAGLFYATTPHAFVTACDSPFLKKEVIEAIIDRIEPGHDAIIPELSVGLEPLCAVYARKCLNRIEDHLSREKLKIQMVFKKNRIKTIPEKTLQKIDPDLISFININSAEDLEKAEALSSKLKI